MHTKKEEVLKELIRTNVFLTAKERHMVTPAGEPSLWIFDFRRIFFTASERAVQVSETHLPGEAYRPVTILERVAQQNSSHIHKP